MNVVQDDPAKIQESAESFNNSQLILIYLDFKIALIKLNTNMGTTVILFSFVMSYSNLNF